jgi:hypothetical protein
MPFPKHNYAFVVMGAYGRLLRSNGEGRYYDGNFGDVFTERRVADWIVRYQQRTYRRLAESDAQNQRKEWLRHARDTRVLRIALPGSYLQPNYEALLELSREEATFYRKIAMRRNGC